MSQLTIQKFPYETLQQKATPVVKEELASKKFQQFVKNLMITLENEYPLGAGLSANQVGELKRIFVVNLEIEPGKFLKQTFINPEIIYQSKETQTDWEGCLSFPNQWGQVERPISIKIRALNLSGEKFEINASNFYASLLRHETDHLNGIVFTDKIKTEIVNTKELNKILRKQDKRQDNVLVG